MSVYGDLEMENIQVLDFYGRALLESCAGFVVG